eukprot:28839_4
MGYLRQLLSEALPKVLAASCLLIHTSKPAFSTLSPSHRSRRPPFARPLAQLMSNKIQGARSCISNTIIAFLYFQYV